MNQTAVTNRNGVNVDRLVGTIEAVKGNPAIAQFNFRAQTNWVNGGQSKTTIQGFYGALQEDSSRASAFVMTGDEPDVLLGANAGPNAVEAILHALGSCLAVGISYNAAALGIELESLSIDMNGDLDLHAFLGLSDQKRAGYEGIKVKINTQSSANPEQLQQLMQHVTRTSPVLDIITNPVPVEVGW